MSNITKLRFGQFIIITYITLIVGIVGFSVWIYETKYSKGKNKEIENITNGKEDLNLVKNLFQGQAIFGVFIMVYCTMFLIKTYLFPLLFPSIKYYEKFQNNNFELSFTNMFVLWGLVFLSYIYIGLLFGVAGTVGNQVIDQVKNIYGSESTNSFMGVILIIPTIILGVLLFTEKPTYGEEISKKLSNLNIDKFRIKLEKDISNKIIDFQKRNEKLESRIENNKRLLKSNTILDSSIRQRREDQLENLEKLKTENEEGIKRLIKNRDGYKRKFDRLEKLIKDDSKVESAKEIIDIINKEWENLDKEDAAEAARVEAARVEAERGGGDT